MKSDKFLGKCPVNIITDVPIGVDNPSVVKWFVVGYYCGTSFRIVAHRHSFLDAVAVADSYNRNRLDRAYHVYSLIVQMHFTNYEYR